MRQLSELILTLWQTLQQHAGRTHMELTVQRPVDTARLKTAIPKQGNVMAAVIQALQGISVKTVSKFVPFILPFYSFVFYFHFYQIKCASSTLLVWNLAYVFTSVTNKSGFLPVLLA